MNRMSCFTFQHEIDVMSNSSSQQWPLKGTVITFVAFVAIKYCCNSSVGYDCHDC